MREKARLREGHDEHWADETEFGLREASPRSRDALLGLGPVVLIVHEDREIAEPADLGDRVERRALGVGTTVTVGFQLADVAGANVSSAAATIAVSQLRTTPSGTDSKPVCATKPTSGSAFVYNASTKQYVFYLGTTGLTAGDYKVSASLDDGSRIVGQHWPASACWGSWCFQVRRWRRRLPRRRHSPSSLSRWLPCRPR